MGWIRLFSRCQVNPISKLLSRYMFTIMLYVLHTCSSCNTSEYGHSIHTHLGQNIVYNFQRIAISHHGNVQPAPCALWYSSPVWWLTLKHSNPRVTSNHSAWYIRLISKMLHYIKCRPGDNTLIRVQTSV